MVAFWINFSQIEGVSWCLSISETFLKVSFLVFYSIALVLYLRNFRGRSVESSLPVIYICCSVAYSVISDS